MVILYQDSDGKFMARDRIVSAKLSEGILTLQIRERGIFIDQTIGNVQSLEVFDDAIAKVSKAKDRYKDPEPFI